MAAALGVRRSQGASPRFSGAKISAASAPGCVLAPLAFFRPSLPLQKGEAKSWVDGGLQISPVKWSLWHLGYSCARLIRARRARSSLAKECLLLDLGSFPHLTHETEQREGEREGKKKKKSRWSCSLLISRRLSPPWCVSALAYRRDWMDRSSGLTHFVSVCAFSVFVNCQWHKKWIIFSTFTALPFSVALMTNSCTRTDPNKPRRPFETKNPKHGHLFS